MMSVCYDAKLNKYCIHCECGYDDIIEPQEYWTCANCEISIHIDTNETMTDEIPFEITEWEDDDDDEY